MSETRKSVLDEVMSASRREDIERGARLRLIGVFAAPPKRGRPGCITGAGHELTDLATFIQTCLTESMRRKVFDLKDLPRSYSRKSERERQGVLRAVRHELFLSILRQMQETQGLWREGTAWVVAQHVLDEINPKHPKQSYRNDHGWHGRPRRDRQRFSQLGLAPGVSVSAPK